MLVYASELTKQLVYDVDYSNHTETVSRLRNLLVDELSKNINNKLGIIVKNVVYYNMRSLKTMILNRSASKKNYFNSIKIGMFISYILICVLAYLFIWSPYVRRLDIEVIRTKSMVSIIPFEIIRQVADIQKYILDNIIFAN